MLSLTRCSDDEFTCTDGACVPSTKRCDLRDHCSDGSDEDGCHNIVTPAGYRPNLPPPPVLTNSLTAPVEFVMQIER